MAKVKIISNPYNREIMYLTFREQSGLWEKIEVYNPNSRLREDESGKSFLPFKIKEIIDIIIAAIIYMSAFALLMQQGIGRLLSKKRVADKGEKA